MWSQRVRQGLSDFFTFRVAHRTQRNTELTRSSVYYKRKGLPRWH